MNRGVEKFIRSLKQRGWYVIGHDGRCHVRLGYKPGGEMRVSLTPSDVHWVRNAERRAQEVEAKYGPYVPVKSNLSDIRGYDYEVQENSSATSISRKDALSQLIPDINLKVTTESNVSATCTSPISQVVEPAPIERRVKFWRPEEKPIKQKETTMTNLDKDIILVTLKARAQELYKELQPKIELFKEYTRLQAAINQLDRTEMTEEQKKEEFLKRMPVPKESVVLPKSENTPRPGMVFVKGKKFYELCEKIVQANDNFLSADELTKWLVDKERVDLTNKTLSPKAFCLQKIRIHNVEHPDEQTLHLVPDPDSSRGWIKAIEYRKGINDGFNGGSGDNELRS